MSRNEKEPSLPSYEDSVAGSSTGTSQINRVQAPPRGQQLLDQLTLVRAEHIRSVIDDHIFPLVEKQALYGISRTLIAMIPSDVPIPAPAEKSEFSFDTDEKKVEVIGFSSDEEPQIVRLEGQMDRTEFWRVQSVVEELERRLKDALNASPNIRAPSPREAQPPAPKPSRNFFGRIADRMNQEERDPNGNPEVGVKQPEVGQVLVKVRLEEIVLRTVNDFGLYDTMSKQCVIIRVDARC
jgi:hypothetical protein